MKRFLSLFICVCVLISFTNVYVLYAKDIEQIIVSDEIFSSNVTEKTKSLSTSELLHEILEFPYLCNILLEYNKLEESLDVLSIECESYKEFLQRKDALFVLQNMKNTLNETLEDPFINEEILYRAEFDLNVIEIFIKVILDTNSYELFSTVPLRVEANGIYYNFDHNIYTPIGHSPVALYKAERGLNSTEMLRAKKLCLDRYPNITYLSRADSFYNCHAYGWYSQSTDMVAWMMDPTPYWNDGSYKEESTPSIGSKVYYTPVYTSSGFYIAGDHSGVVTQIASNISSYTITSKWGASPLFSHKISDCDYYYVVNGKPNIKFYDTSLRIGIKSFQRYINTHLPSQYLGTPLVIDGNFGPASRSAAIKLLQYWLNNTYGAGLAIDGGFGTLTYNACVTLAQGSSGMGVYILQGLLYGNGYDPNGFDGSFGVNGGTGCLNAVKAFQKAKGLSVDGRAGRDTFRALCS